MVLAWVAANKFAAVVTVLLVGAVISTTTLGILYSNEINDDTETTVPTQPPTVPPTAPPQTQAPTPPPTAAPTAPPTPPPTSRPDDFCAQPKEGMINVHLVPHSHDDVGWLKTVDQYFYGSRTNIQRAGVKNIIDSVVTSLLEDPARRFIYVESAFFFKWWDQQTEKRRDQVKMLVSEGRLEFIGGAWSMNDEATVHYHSVIDQFAWGLRRLNDTFGPDGRPKVAWQIDPFGHSREMASLLAQMGYNGVFFARIDSQDKQKRLNEKSLEMIWHGSANLGSKSNLFTGTLYNHYSPPGGFCFDILCSDDPIIDDEKSVDNNVDNRVNAFINYVTQQSQVFRTNQVIETMGDDFHYYEANAWYTNLDKLIRHVNERQSTGSNVNVFYSTPSCYVKAQHAANIEWPTKDDDFFPYGSDPHTYWTGYFTSRPTLKRFERVGNQYLQVCKQLSALAPTKNDNFEENISELRSAMGIMQHHDAVTGTEKQHVAEDYARILTEAIEACNENVHEVLSQINSAPLSANVRASPRAMLNFETCQSLNISSCHVSEENSQFVVTVYNPLAYTNSQAVRVPVNTNQYTIRDNTGATVVTQFVPVPKPIVDLSYRVSSANYEVVFLASDLPPLGYKSYYVTRDNNDVPHEPIVATADDDDFPINIGNSNLRIYFNSTGQLQKIVNGNVESKLQQQLFYYESFAGDNRESARRSSGAYAFRPDSEEKLLSERVEITVYKGPVVEEVHQKFNEWVSQVIRVYANEDHVEFDWLIGDIPINDGRGKEIVSRFLTDIASDKTFYTDANGREVLKRIRDYRPTWNVDIVEPESGNYYPITAKIAIEDNAQRLAVLNDRSQGGSSLFNGTVDLMLHRRTLNDDAFGVGEALNEQAYGKGLIARGELYLMFGAANTLKAQERIVQTKKLLPRTLFFSDASGVQYDHWLSVHRNKFSGLAESLPQYAHLLTLEPWHDGKTLIRLEHTLEKTDLPNSAPSVTINLRDVFKNYNLSEIRETTLAGNQWADEALRYAFKEENSQRVSDNENGSESYVRQATGDPYTVTLQPMEIRTFVLKMNL